LYNRELLFRKIINMNPTDKIKQLQSEIEKEKRIIKDCKHTWGDTKYDPYTVQEPHFDHYEPHGSDPEPIFNYYPKDMPRWSRTCKECGHTEYTEKQGPIEPVKNGPIFK